MELTIKCPDCGKELKVTIEEATTVASKAVLTKKQEETVSWLEIAERIHAGSENAIEVGDEIACTLKDGTEVVFVAAAINPYVENEVAFVIKDCLPDLHNMNDDCTNEGGWRDSGMREYVNGKIYDLLPDDLKSVIKERTIVQKQDDEELSSTDKLWLLSRTEVTGTDYETDVNDVHFPLFKDERSRVKQVDGETYWYWLRSPYASSSSAFCYVYANGGASYNNANASNGVAFGFLI